MLDGTKGFQQECAIIQLGKNNLTLHQQVSNKQNTDGGLGQPALASNPHRVMKNLYLVLIASKVQIFLKPCKLSSSNVVSIQIV
jgi:hypothetical protein